MLSVIIPASNEAGYIAGCLNALFAAGPAGSEAVVVANGCRDTTVAVARSCAAAADRSGWRLVVLELAQGSKPNALNRGDETASGDMRVYLDADVVVSAGLMAELAAVLQAPGAVYATGTARIPRAESWVTRQYARFWQRLPFARMNAPGYGLFAVNAQGRARWGKFPALISDDTFVRLHFDPAERVQVAAWYDWPMIEGFSALVRVRRRQDAGVVELAQLHPDLMTREAKPGLSLGQIAALALRDPLGFAVYAAVSLKVRLGRNTGWSRGR